MDGTTDGQPSPTEGNGDGRDPASGRFTAHNGFGRGNPHTKKIGQLRSALLDTITPEDVAAIMAKLIAQARAGDLACAREVLDRVLGKPAVSITADLEVTTPDALSPEQHQRMLEIVRRVDATEDD